MFESVVKELQVGGRIYQVTPPESQAQLQAMAPAELQAEVEAILARPQVGYVIPSHRFVMNLALAAQWLGVFEELQLPRAPRLFEPCVGSSEPVILAAEAYSGGQASYTSLNLNRLLRAELQTKIGGLRSQLRIIEDHAQAAGQFVPPGSIHCACFHHAINDILQTAVSEPRGLDTREIEWWSNERQMIEWLAEEAAAGQLAARARPALLAAVGQAAAMVEPGGYLLFDHWTFWAHKELDWFPWELFCNLLPLARGWIQEAYPALTEQPLAGKDPQWWMCLQKPA